MVFVFDGALLGVLVIPYIGRKTRGIRDTNAKIKGYTGSLQPIMGIRYTANRVFWGIQGLKVKGIRDIYLKYLGGYGIAIPPLTGPQYSVANDLPHNFIY